MPEERTLNILLVDDEEIVHETLDYYLTDCGHRITRTYDGPTALESVETHPYDLAFVDIRMPGMDGIALLEQIRSLRPKMTVIIMTGHGSDDIEAEVLRLGALAMLVKPIRLIELDDILAKHGLQA